MLQTIEFESTERQELINLMEQVQQVVTESGYQEGLCYVYCPHTTAGLVVNSYLDPKTLQDIAFELDRLIPTRVDFFHTFDTPSDAAAHVKSTLTGISQDFVIHEGKLLLGHSQGILFAEFDGPRKRRVTVKVIEA